MKVNDGYRRFRESVFGEYADLFARLEQGQQPEVMFVTCSDSRIQPALITQTLPGELFVIRNAGNLVPTRQADGVAATLEYGVKALKVKHIVICGHSHCGAVAAALQPESLADLPYVEAYLRESGPQLGALPEDPAERLTAAVEQNVVRQLDNLRSFPFVAEAVDAGQLELHGWVYRFEAGEIRGYDAASGQFVSLQPQGGDAKIASLTPES